MNQINLNDAFKCVQTIVGSCRCVNCDQLHDKRYRYTCGHSLCERCSSNYDFCLLCLLPSLRKPVKDNPQNVRVKNATVLLNTFQDLFNVDVFKRQRISDQLKIEKKIFPECIQAPAKYFNKRKSHSASLKNKENINLSYLPGETIGSMDNSRIEKSINCVQEWFNQNENSCRNNQSTRKPFSELSVNKQPNVNKKCVVNRRKRSFIDSAFYDDFELDQINETVKRNKKSKVKSDSLISKKIKSLQSDNKESAAVDEETIVINDSQSEVIDKDTLALLAVVEAETNKKYSKDVCIDISDQTNKLPTKCCIESTSTLKVPFYKKGVLFETCNLCKESIIEIDNKNKTNKNIIVTIDSKSFVTTIKLSEYRGPTKTQPGDKQDRSVQTDVISNSENRILMDGHKEATTNNYTSQDLFKDDENNVHTHPLGCVCISCILIQNEKTKTSKCLIINDSDTDSFDNDDNKLIEVKAEVHRSSEIEDYVLTPLQPQEYQNRVRPLVRGKTPASSDSSDKENFDPNKKRPKFNKKKNKRKKLK